MKRTREKSSECLSYIACAALDAMRHSSVPSREMLGGAVPSHSERQLAAAASAARRHESFAAADQPVRRAACNLSRISSTRGQGRSNPYEKKANLDPSSRGAVRTLRPSIAAANYK